MNTIMMCCEIVSTEANEQTMDWLNFGVSLATFLLGVITVALSIRYITNKRREAKYGFYSNLFAFIKRIQYFTDNELYSGITDYLCSSEMREEILKTRIPMDRATIVMPQFNSLCKEFVTFLSNAENNIPPRHYGNNSRDREGWEKWYEDIFNIIVFAQECAFMDLKRTPYFTEESLPEYINKRELFEKSLKDIEKELQKLLYEK